MADPETNIGLLPANMFSFFANAPAGSGLSQPAMEARRRMVLQLMANSGKKGYPKNLGEGLTAIGDALGERGMMNQLAAQEAAYQKRAAAAAEGSVPGEAQTGARTAYASPDDSVDNAPAPEAGPVATAAPAAPMDTAADLTPAEAQAGVSSGGYNLLDAQAGMKRQGTGRAQDVATSIYPNNPDMQAYTSQMAAGEQSRPGEVSSTGARGMFQFVPGTAAQYGLTNPDNDLASGAAFKKFTADNAATFERINGRPPTMAELAVMHQQGGRTGSNMVAGTGNASPRNLVLNNVPAGAGPAQAVGAIKNYYGMPDRPVNARDAVAQAMMMRPTAQAVPQPNPTSTGGPTMPPTSPAGMSPSPSTPAPAGGPALGPPPDQRMAFAGLPPEIATGVSAAPPVPPALQAVPKAAAPTTPPATPQRLAPQARMPILQDVPMTDDQKRGYRIKAQGLAMGDDNIVKQGQSLIDYGANQQTQEYNARLKDWQDQMAERRQRQQAEEAFARTQSTPQAQAEADIVKRFSTTAAHQKAIDDASKSYDATQQLANTLPTFRQAKQALAQSYTGSGSELKLDASKMLRMLGVPGDYTPSVATEMLQSRMKAIAGGMIKSTVGSQNISDADREFVEKAYSGTIKMEPESIRKLLSIAEDTTIRSINRHNDRLQSVFSDAAKDAAVRNNYAVPMQYGDDAVAYLKSHPDTANMFDAKFGKGHAKAVLMGTRYGG